MPTYLIHWKGHALVEASSPDHRSRPVETTSTDGFEHWGLVDLDTEGFVHLRSLEVQYGQWGNGVAVPEITGDWFVGLVLLLIMIINRRGHEDK